MTQSINDLIMNLDTTLANYEFNTVEPTTESLRDYLQAELLNFHDIRKPYDNKQMFDVDIDDYTVTIHYYKEPSDIPTDAIQLGVCFYMYPDVEVAEPCYLGMRDIVQVYDTNYNKQYAIVAE